MFEGSYEHLRRAVRTGDRERIEFLRAHGTEWRSISVADDGTISRDREFLVWLISNTNCPLRPP